MNITQTHNNLTRMTQLPDNNRLMLRST